MKELFEKVYITHARELPEKKQWHFIGDYKGEIHIGRWTELGWQVVGKDKLVAFIDIDWYLRPITEFKAKMPSEEEIDESNPYPESVFIPITDEKLEEVSYHLRQAGYSPDALFGHWGRIVWNNCCGWFRNRMSNPNNSVEGKE